MEGEGGMVKIMKFQTQKTHINRGPLASGSSKSDSPCLVLLGAGFSSLDDTRDLDL